MLGVVLKALAGSDRMARVAMVIFSLGMMFYSMTLVVQGGTGMEKDPLFQYTINYFHDRPIVSLMIAAILTALMASSAATIAFVMSMMMARHGTVYEAIPWVLGANLGTTATAFVASFRSGVWGNRRLWDICFARQWESLCVFRS